MDFVGSNHEGDLSLDTEIETDINVDDWFWVNYVFGANLYHMKKSRGK